MAMYGNLFRIEYLLVAYLHSLLVYQPFCYDLLKDNSVEREVAHDRSSSELVCWMSSSRLKLNNCENTEEGM